MMYMAEADGDFFLRKQIISHLKSWLHCLYTYLQRQVIVRCIEQSSTLAQGL